MAPLPVSPTQYTITGTITTGGTQVLTYGATPYTNINNAFTTDTVEVGTGEVTTSTLSNNRTENALLINGAGLTVGGAANGTLALTSGGLMVTGGSDTLSVSRLALGAVEGVPGGITRYAQSQQLDCHGIRGSVPRGCHGQPGTSAPSST